MLRFTINRIPVRVHPVFWIIAVFLGFDVFEGFELAAWVAVVFVSVLVHEMGHAFTAQAFGRRPVVMLHAFGGVTSWPALPELPPARRVMVTLAGPFAGFALAGIGWLAFSFGGLDEANRVIRNATVALIWVNLVWGIFNLVPIRGLDGGQTVAGLLDLWWPKRAALVAEVVYVAAGAAAVVFGVLRGFYLLAVFAVILTVSGFGGVRRLAPAPPPDGSGLRSPRPPSGEAPPLPHEQAPSPRPPERDPEPPRLGI